MSTTRMCLIAAFCLLSTTALAQEGGGQAATFQKRTVVDFSELTIQGELSRPEGVYILSRKKTRFKTLLSPRPNFLQELIRSTDNL